MNGLLAVIIVPSPEAPSGGLWRQYLDLGRFRFFSRVGQNGFAPSVEGFLPGVPARYQGHLIRADLEGFGEGCGTGASTIRPTVEG